MWPGQIVVGLTNSGIVAEYQLRTLYSYTFLCLYLFKNWNLNTIFFNMRQNEYLNSAVIDHCLTLY